MNTLTPSFPPMLSHSWLLFKCLLLLYYFFPFPYFLFSFSLQVSREKTQMLFCSQCDCRVISRRQHPATTPSHPSVHIFFTPLSTIFPVSRGWGWNRCPVSHQALKFWAATLVTVHDLLKKSSLTKAEGCRSLHRQTCIFIRQFN